MHDKIIVDIWHKIDVIVLLISNFFTACLIKCTSPFLLFITFIVLSWVPKLRVDLNANFSLFNAHGRTSNYEEEIFELSYIERREFWYHADESATANIGKCALTLLFIPSYFWFLQSLYYDSRPILGQSHFQSYVFIAAAISRNA